MLQPPPKYKYAVTHKKVMKRTGDVVLQKIYLYEKPVGADKYPVGHENHVPYEELQ